MNENWTERKELPRAVIDQDGIVWVLRQIGGPLYSHSELAYLRNPQRLEEAFGPCTPMIAEPEAGLCPRCRQEVGE